MQPESPYGALRSPGESDAAKGYPGRRPRPGRLWQAEGTFGWSRGAGRVGAGHHVPPPRGPVGIPGAGVRRVWGRAAGRGVRRVDDDAVASTGGQSGRRPCGPGGISSNRRAQHVGHSRQYIDPNRPPQIVDLGPAEGKSVREWTHTKRDERLGAHVIAEHPKNHKLLELGRHRRALRERAAVKRAAHYPLEARHN
jgi:hypothetical protein